jgi:hypothetical protein
MYTDDSTEAHIGLEVWLADRFLHSTGERGARGIPLKATATEA